MISPREEKLERSDTGSPQEQSKVPELKDPYKDIPPSKTEKAKSASPSKTEKAKSASPSKTEKAKSASPSKTEKAKSASPSKTEKAKSASPSKTEKAKGDTSFKSKKAKGELPPMTENENLTKKISDLVNVYNATDSSKARVTSSLNKAIIGKYCDLLFYNCFINFKEYLL